MQIVTFFSRVLQSKERDSQIEMSKKYKAGSIQSDLCLHLIAVSFSKWRSLVIGRYRKVTFEYDSFLQNVTSQNIIWTETNI